MNWWTRMKPVPNEPHPVPSTAEDVMFFALKYQDKLFRRAAYICDGGEVKQVHDEGYATVSAAFVARPKGCQYAILVNTEGTVLLVDMFDLQTRWTHTTLEYKEEGTRTFPTVEAAIMYAVTTY